MRSLNGTPERPKSRRRGDSWFAALSHVHVVRGARAKSGLWSPREVTKDSPYLEHNGLPSTLRGPLRVAAWAALSK